MEARELTEPASNGSKRDWPLIVGLAGIGVALLGLLPAYFIFWHRSDVVFDKRAVEIPLSAPLRKAIEDALGRGGRDSTSAKNGEQVTASPGLPGAKLPDQLLYVNVRNVGKIPSSLVRVQILVPGPIADKEILGAGPVLGDVTQLRDLKDGIYFECPNLVNESDAKLKVAIWYQKTNSGAPSVQVMETVEGPAREVGSVDSTSFYLFSWPERHPWLGFLLPVALTGLVIWPINWVIDWFATQYVERTLKRRQIE